MQKYPTGGNAMRLYDHIVADWAVTQNAVTKAAMALDPRLSGTAAGRAAEAEVSRLSVELIRKMHALSDLMARLGPGAAFEVFGPRLVPLTPEEREVAKL